MFLLLSFRAYVPKNSQKCRDRAVVAAMLKIKKFGPLLVHRQLGNRTELEFSNDCYSVDRPIREIYESNSPAKQSTLAAHHVHK